MSADRQRLTSAIRRIAKTDPEIRGLLDAADNKGGKPGAAGVGGGQGEGKEYQICCDGSVGDPNPGVDERDATDGDQDGLDPNDPANLGGLDGGSLTGVTDCATGEPICFDGDGVIPPDGWDAPDDPPIKDGYQESYYWVLVDNEGRVTRGATPRIAAEKNAELRYSDNGCIAAVYVISTDLDGDPDVYRADYVQCSDGSNLGQTNNINRRACGTSTADYCTEVPYEKSWPTDGCVNLAVKSGTIVGSKYDPENSAGDYSAPRTSIDLCSGTDQISLAPAANGGWKTINSTTNNGYLYDSSGKQIAHIDGNEYSDPSV